MFYKDYRYYLGQQNYWLRASGLYRRLPVDFDS